MWVICFLVLRFYPKNAEPERSPNFSHHLSLRWAKKRLGWPTNIIKNKMLKYLCSRSLHFLYDGEQRIMISPAIGDADRLSSCSWKLRRKYSQQSNLLTRVMVFQQPPDDAFKGEKGMTTFRYNLNGVELQPAAFNKLQSEIALRQFKLRLPGDKYHTRFYVGEYPDTTGEIHKVVIREAQVKVWQEDSEDYPLTDILYYEVVTNKTILNTLKKRVI